MISQQQIDAFAQGFASLNSDNLERLAELYHPEVQFTDPLHQVHGLAALEAYCSNLYSNLKSVRFEFSQCSPVDDEQALLCWTLYYRHPRLAGGREVSVPGVSQVWLRDAKVYRHRDHYDAGALLYEHIPLLGSVIRLLKRRLT